MILIQYETTTTIWQRAVKTNSRKTTVGSEGDEMPTIRERLIDHRVIQIYVQMISNADIQIVKDLRENLKIQAAGHSKQIELEKLFIERLGE